ncbi:MAG: flagellar hook-associated protein FlgK [Firmicutes bacterium]|nr:flagellar hook-associated protein FlgK [Bacillota bacterium]
MPGTFFGVEIGRRGLQTHQKALDVTSHNLTNSSTEGYTRQRAVFTQTDPYTSPELNSSANTGQLGSGVTTSMIDRIRDQYLDPQVRKATTDRYYWEDQIDIYKRMESCYAEPASSGISEQIVDFFKNWMELNNNPQDAGVKASVMEYGVQLATQMSYTFNQMTYIQESIITPGTSTDVASGQIKDQVERINDLLTQIQNYTEGIMKIYKVGQQPNDLLDKRDLLLDELAQYGSLDVEYATENCIATGEITMNFLGVNITTVPRDDKTFSLQINSTSGNIELHEASQGLVVDLSAEKDNTELGGSLLGLENARQSIIAFKDTLDDIAVNLREKIIEKNSDLPAASITEFFTGSLADGNFQVNSQIVNNSSLIDGTKAGDIASINDEEMDADRTYTLEECYALLTTDIGAKAAGADGMAATQQAIQEQMYNLRESVAGVSVDEEMANMIQFQYGYQGSARVVSMMDELLDYLINRMAQ